MSRQLHVDMHMHPSMLEHEHDGMQSGMLLVCAWHLQAVHSGITSRCSGRQVVVLHCQVVYAGMKHCCMLVQFCCFLLRHRKQLTCARHGWPRPLSSGAVHATYQCTRHPLCSLSEVMEVKPHLAALLLFEGLLQLLQ